MKIGNRFAIVLSLTTALTFPAIFTTGALAQETDPQIADEVEDEEYPDISLPGANTIIVTGRINRDPTRSSSQVISVLSSEQIARTGEGDIAGALSRVTGLSVQGQGFVFVRGLGDRYSLALLNGSPLPSPQPLSRVVPLDIFPTGIIASSLVQKTYSANFPGEFGGGVINLTTRAVPDESFLSVGMGVSGNTETTFHNGLSYYGSGTDWSAFDDGTRDIPPALQDFFASGERINDLSIEQQAAIGKQLGNPNLILLQKIGDIPANWSGSLTGGTAIDFGSDGRLGVIGTASISNEWRTRDIFKQLPLQNFSSGTDINEIATDNRITVNGLLGFGAEFGEQQIRWTNLFIRDTLKQARLAEGEDFVDDESYQQQQTGWYERQLINSQFVGEFELGRVSLDLRGGYAQTQREAPYEYDFVYLRSNTTAFLGDQFVNQLDGQEGDARVAFSNLEEELWYGGADISVPLLDWMSGTVGYAYSDTTRYSERREFAFRNTDGTRSPEFRQGVGLLRPDLLLGDAIIDYFRLRLVEPGENAAAFDAGLEVHAGYAMLRGEPAEGFSFDVGVRYEDAQQFVNPVEVFNTPIAIISGTSLDNSYWLPSGTVTVTPFDDLQVRAHASRTIARPQFRELIFLPYFDPEISRSFEGNPFLVDSELTNYELRAEYYMGRGRSVSVAGFYKDIKNPIEVFSRFNDNAQTSSFANAPRATLMGVEVDGQYNFDLADLGGLFSTKELVVVANYTYTTSDISVKAGDTTLNQRGAVIQASDLFRDGSQLTGQSDHIANLQLTLEDTERLQQFTALVSYGSERVTSRGSGAIPDVVEDPGIKVDLVVRQGLNLFGRDAEFKLEARNIFGRINEEFLADANNRLEINTYKIGTSLSASVSVDF
ncbi:TonB-dependent receptor [Altererythrobacter sp. KTW20L]|uniref:TonB-dependent receptor domain-containing protein n=1 Tax=Altererythrobacter sp. KTW20L TaxID=2942210 RepID=UPI0020BEBF1F|nr:TonB-dependent receptor [Altererythrobacter sp. KTW20L]MCL6250373.1 TonB-dependent receptor [Altererythrobacter sp. KTW20L]